MTRDPDALLEAGNAALEAGDWPAARESFRAALDLVESAEALNGLGQALWWLGETHESVAYRERAYTEFRRRPDPEQAATIALGLCVHYQANIGNPAASAGWLARATRLVEEFELEDFRGWLLLLEAAEANDAAAGEKLARETKDVAASSGDLDLELCASRPRCRQVSTIIATLRDGGIAQRRAWLCTRVSRHEAVWDCAIVGGGAAGLSAALVLGRARRRVLVLDAGEQSNLPAHGIGGLLGHDGLPPAELYALGRKELAAYPSVELRQVSVTRGAREDDRFVLSTADGAVVDAARVLLAPGMEYDVPNLPGAVELWGGAVFHCPYCHGWEVRDRALAVLGDAHAVYRALLLRGWSADVVLLTNGPAELEADERARLERAGVRVDERPVASVRGRDEALEAVLFADGDELARDALLVSAPLRQRTSLATDLGAELTERGTVDVDAFGQTTVPGLYAAGDVSAAMQQVAGAIADGARAAGAINDSLLAEQHGIDPMMPRRDAAPIA